MAASADNWIFDYELCEKTYREILEKTNRRDNHGSNTEGYAQLSVAIRMQTKQFANDLVNLRQNLIRASSSSYITQRESERRQIMLQNLEHKQSQLHDASSKRNIALANDKSRLFNQDFASSSTAQHTFEESDDTRYLPIEDIRAQQEIMIREQDQGLDALSAVISRQKQIGFAIADEIDGQNEIIDDIADHVDQTHQKLIKETKHVRIVDRKSGACGFWVVIILLLIAIVVVSVVPTHH